MLQSELEEQKSLVDGLTQIKDQLEEKILELSELPSSVKPVEVESEGKKSGSCESGGSGGWSDIEKDVDLVQELGQTHSPPTKRTSPPVHISDFNIKELAKAKAEIKDLSKEKDRLATLLETEKTRLEALLTTEKAKLESLLLTEKNRFENLSKETAQLNTQIDQANQEIERQKAVISKLEEEKKKLEELRNEDHDYLKQVTKLKDEYMDQVMTLNKDLATFNLERNNLERTTKEQEQKLKKAEERENKLRSQIFHDDRERSKKLKALEEVSL